MTGLLRRTLWFCLRTNMPEAITRRVERAYRNRHDRERMLKHWEREYAEVTARMAEAECRGERPWACLAGDGLASDPDSADWDLHGDVGYPSSRRGPDA